MKQLRTKKRKINSKKGISMVLAIALVAVLFLSTTTFLSIAMLQQNETGTSMNARQAYVSAKSALDMAQQLLNEGKLTEYLPSAEGDSVYLVFYYDTNGDIVIKSFSSSEEALKWINNNKDTYTIIGNAYIKITNDGNNNFTITAVGVENKYTGSDAKNTGDLSAKVKLTYALDQVPHDQKVSMHQKKVNTTSTPSGTNFLMVGDQTAFSLLRNVPKANDQYHTLKNSVHLKIGDSNKLEDDVVYIPRVESNSAPVTTAFPIVFDKVVQIDSDNEDRCRYSAYNNAIYLLGDYSGYGVNNTRQPDQSGYSPYRNESNVCFFTNNSAYGSTFDCKLLVVGGNMLCTVPDEGSPKVSLCLKYSGDVPTYDGVKGVVVRFTKDCTLKTFTQDGKQLNYKNVTYKQGYYFIKIYNNNNGVDLFSPDTFNNCAIRLSNDSASKEVLDKVKDIDLYDTIKSKDMHSAHEDAAITGTAQKAQVNILGYNGTFNTTESKTYSTNSGTINNNNYESGYDNYSIYCGPAASPTSPGYYEMYSDEFNFQWYNTNSFDVGANTHITMRANNIVLTIGPKTDEKIYEIRDNNNSNWKTVNSFIFPGYTKYNDFHINETYSTNVSNVIKQTDASATFEIKPYWNKESLALSVMNDFEVSYNGGTYTIKKGDYTNIPSNGLNLFSDTAKTYFESNSGSKIEGNKDSVNWVNADGSINSSIASNNSVLDQNSKAINFKASLGGDLVNGATYKAGAIYCDFGDVTYGNNAIIKGDVVELGADTISYFNTEKDSSGETVIKKTNGIAEIKGYLKIDSSSGYSTNADNPGSYCIREKKNGDTTTTETLKGSMLRITKKTKLILDNGTNFTLEPGYYYFPHTSDSFYINLLSADFWKDWKEGATTQLEGDNSNYYYYVTALDTYFDAKTAFTTKPGKLIPVDFEGKYF